MVEEIKHVEKVSQGQIHDLLFGDKVSWQAIINDLVNTEQLDPRDINISFLVEKYLAKIQNLEEANFFVSSKVLLAASILLRMKSDILLHDEIPGLDEILFGNKNKKKYEQERIELDEEMPDLIPRTPLPRFKRVTLQELMNALGKAIKTENRRIKKEVILRQYEREAGVVLPKNVIDLEDKIKGIYAKLLNIFKNQEDKFPFSKLGHENREDKIAEFVSLLHLNNQEKIWIEQENHFGEIWILLKSLYEEKNKNKRENVRLEVEKFMEENYE